MTASTLEERLASFYAEAIVGNREVAVRNLFRNATASPKLIIALIEEPYKGRRRRHKTLTTLRQHFEAEYQGSLFQLDAMMRTLVFNPEVREWNRYINNALAGLKGYAVLLAEAAVTEADREVAATAKELMDALAVELMSRTKVDQEQLVVRLQSHIYD